eukprot:1809446-Pyramimonas_sp.AAC.1
MGGAFGGTPYGATQRLKGVPNWSRWAHASAGIWASGGASNEATKRVRGVPKCVRRAHANADIWAFGEAPHCGHEPC